MKILTLWIVVMSLIGVLFAVLEHNWITCMWALCSAMLSFTFYLN
jgi:hypothetical protein